MALWGSESPCIKILTFTEVFGKCGSALPEILNLSQETKPTSLPKPAMPLSQTISKRKEFPMKGGSQGGRASWDEKSMHWLLVSHWCLGEGGRMGWCRRDPGDGTLPAASVVCQGAGKWWALRCAAPLPHSLHDPLNFRDAESSFVGLMEYTAGAAIQVSPAEGK